MNADDFMDTVDAAKRSQDKDAEIRRLKAELEKYQRSNKDHWDHLADTASELRYDNQVREGHLDVIRDQRAEIERLKADVEYWHHIATVEKNGLITELCDALEDGGPRPFALIQSAREATR